MHHSDDTNEQIAPVDFNALILAFSSAALYYLGHTSIEGKETREVNLPLAKQNIDIVRLLKEKTLGNLQPEESKLLEQVLDDLSEKFLISSR